MRKGLKHFISLFNQAQFLLVLFFGLILLLFFISYNPFEDTTNSSSHYQEPEVILYQVDGNYPPFSFSNDGDLVGFDFTLTNIIFLHTNSH